MVGVLDEIKAILSPAGAWLWAELGKNNKNNHMVSCILFVLIHEYDKQSRKQYIVRQ